MSDAVKLDIFEVLNNINAKNYNYLDSLDPDVSKQFTPYVVLSWLSSSTDPLQIMLLQEFVNKRFFQLSNHPKLLYRLFCITANNRNMRYNWMYKKQAKSDRVDILSKYFNCSTRVAKLYDPLYSSDDITKMVESLGYQSAEIKKLKL